MNNKLKPMFVGGALLCSTFMTTGASAVEFSAGESKVSVYGFAKFDMIHDVGDIKAGSKGLGDSIKFPNIGVDGTQTTSGHTTMHANESRLGFKTQTPTEQGNLTTVIEGDFWGDGGFRLRHAYGSWNGITAGQTWTNFGSFVYATPTLDFTGPLGRAGINRQAQLRYSTNGFHIALEDPSGTVSGKSFNGDADRKDGLPDLTLRYESKAGALSYALGGVVRQVAFDDGTNDDAAMGWGAFIGANVKFASGTTLRGVITGGEGIGSYLNGAPMPVAYRDGNDLQSITAVGGTLGLSQKLGIGTINLAYSYVEADWDEAQQLSLAGIDDEDEQRQLIHLNYIWQPVDNVSYGVGVARASRQTVAGDSGDATRIRGSVIYSF